jgi:cytochrome c-type biogenesis protein CcmH
MAADMRSEIRERIKAGEAPEHIRAWLVERYGDWISYKPTADPILWPLWAAPLLLLGAGGYIIAGRLKQHKRGHG